MMNIIRNIAVLAFATLVVGCGGSGGSPVVVVDDGPDTGGITGNGIAAGPISNFGSVIVNGIVFNTDSATFTVDDAIASQSDLRVGQFVVVKGEFASDNLSGTATEVIFDDNVQGAISSIDSVGSSLVVLGQTVFIDTSTSFDDDIVPQSIDGLNVGDIIEVSGLVAQDGSITATRIEKKLAGTQLEVHGVVSSIDTAAMRFNINALIVDYSNATLDNFPNGEPADGDFVEVKGNTLGPNQELEAVRVELETGQIDGASGDRVEVEGFVTRFVSATDFDVSGIPVTTDGSTIFEGGVAADLGLNIKVEVEGAFDANGVIDATKVDIRRAKVVRLTGEIDSVSAGGNSLVIFGVTVNTDVLTRFEDKSNLDVDPLAIGDLNAGDYLEVRGTEFPAGSGAVLAALVEREDASTEAELQGFVTSVSDPSITILGVTIETDASTVFRNAADGIISRTEFFDTALDSLVKGTGVESSATVIMATEVEFEIE